MLIQCINLTRRPDRRAQVSAEFEREGLRVEFLPAIDGNLFQKKYKNSAGNQGCNFSHLQAIQRAKWMGLPYAMIFEDDAQLATDFWYKLRETMEMLPANWEVLSMGGTHREKPIAFTDRLMKISRTLTTHGYLLSSRAYDIAIKLLENFEEPVDCAMVEIQKRGFSFVSDPPLAWQRSGFSDIQGRNMAYDWIKSNKQ